MKICGSSVSFTYAGEIYPFTRSGNNRLAPAEFHGFCFVRSLRLHFILPLLQPVLPYYELPAGFIRKASGHHGSVLSTATAPSEAMTHPTCFNMEEAVMQLPALEGNASFNTGGSMMPMKRHYSFPRASQLKLLHSRFFSGLSIIFPVPG